MQKEDLHEIEASSENRKRKFRVESVLKTKDGEKTMIEERNYTPFDGKENDWFSFAKKQAEFYRNAEQYIMNLQIDMKEIDEEIEKILLETEDANFNVTQGYKVFRRLKELRLDRKSKAKELDCLYALTDYIDCDALADTCEENLADIKNIVGISEKSEGGGLNMVDRGREEIHVVENITDMVG